MKKLEEEYVKNALNQLILGQTAMGKAIISLMKGQEVLMKSQEFLMKKLEKKNWKLKHTKNGVTFKVQISLQGD